MFLIGCVHPVGPGDWQPDPVTPAIPLGENGSEPLSFRKVVYRIQSGSVLGDIYVNRKREDEMRWTISRPHSIAFNVAVTDRLRALGYHVRDEADSLFDQREHIKVRYEMAAILHDAALNFYYKPNRKRDGHGAGIGTAEVEVEVRLHDSVEKRTVYSRVFKGRAIDEGMKPNPLVSAVVNAILKTTGDPKFVNLVAIDRVSKTAGSDPHQTVEIAACERPEEHALPKGLPQMLKSVVEIQAGGVAGTGVIISPDGWILTAAHVVVDAPELWVRIDAGAQLPAVLHQVDEEADLALLRIPGKNHPCAPIRIADRKLALGSDVFAINVAIGDDRRPTITRGVVSGYPEKDGRRFIQTDASLNPGSSGGPLLAPDGRVAGITVLKVVGEGIEGLGLAVPAHEAVRQLDILLIDHDE
jgi:S1-C subfamily serine protease